MRKKNQPTNPKSNRATKLINFRYSKCFSEKQVFLFPVYFRGYIVVHVAPITG